MWNVGFWISTTSTFLSASWALVSSVWASSNLASTDSACWLAVTNFSLANLTASFLVLTSFSADLIASARVSSAFFAVLKASSASATVASASFTAVLAFSKFFSAFASPVPSSADSAFATVCSAVWTSFSACSRFSLAVATSDCFSARTAVSVLIWAFVASVASWLAVCASRFLAWASLTSATFAGVAWEAVTSASLTTWVAVATSFSVEATVASFSFTSASAVSILASASFTTAFCALSAGSTVEGAGTSLFSSGFTCGLVTRAGSLTAVSVGTEVAWASWANTGAPTDASAIAVEVVRVLIVLFDIESPKIYKTTIYSCFFI